MNASLQLGAPAAMRGRIIAMYFYVMLGTNVAGGPLMGWIAERWSPGATFAGARVTDASCVGAGAPGARGVRLRRRAVHL